MIINKIKLENFRNFDSCELEFNNDINLFYGKNGSGKTNILEAIFVLILAKSPRQVNDTVMMKNGTDYYRLEGTVESDGTKYEVATAFKRGGRKRITIDQVGIKASELFERFTAVSTAPHDMEILAGSPSKRRDFINIYLSQASIKYIDDLSNYQKVLAQKNAFLKNGAGDDDTPYDDLLIKYGSRIMKARIDFLATVGPIALRHYQKISGGQTLATAYQPSVTLEEGVAEVEIISAAFRGKLHQYRQRERIMQTSMVGPHRDDIEFLIRDFPARSHGSQGELRSAAVSLKLAVYEYLKSIKNVSPVLLLDEIFAELDGDRKEMLVELFGDFEQIFLTSASGIPDQLEQRAKKFVIDNGSVIES